MLAMILEKDCQDIPNAQSLEWSSRVLREDRHLAL
jgi:hypothetical protein